MVFVGKKMQWFRLIHKITVRTILYIFTASLLLAPPITVADQTTLVIGTWGGAYEKAQHNVWFQPFTAKTNIPIKTLTHKGGLEILLQNKLPDVLDMGEADARRACDKGLLEPLNLTELLPEAVSNEKIEEDFMHDAFSKCAIAHSTASTLIAYNPKAFLGKKPQTIADFFDIESYPGKRGLRKEPHDFLEWALMAEGIPASQIYDMLSTPRGMKLAFKQMDKIRDHIVWWDWPHEPAELLKAGKVTMTSGFNGRFFAEQSTSNPIILIWDGQLIDKDAWAIPVKENVHPAAREFIRFAMESRQLARLAEQIPYAPVRHSAMWQIGNHPESGIPMLDHLPTAPHHLKNALFRDNQWYANTEKFRTRAFYQWLNEGQKLPE